MKQIIVARKDLKLSPGKLAAQVAHASGMYFMKNIIKNIQVRQMGYGSKEYRYTVDGMEVEIPIYEDWMLGEYKKCVLAAKNKNDLLKLKAKAEEAGLKEGADFFLIYDNCHTELETEEENGTTLTCIGFKPMQDDVIDKITKRYRLY